MKYNILIKKTLEKKRQIEAKSKEEALEIAELKYMDADDNFVLYPDDKSDLEILIQDSEETEKTNDSVNHPSHYADIKAPCECIDVIHYVIENLPPTVALGIGNLQKYIWRLGKKSPDTNKNQTIAEKTLEDLKKAQWYLQDAINEMTMFVEAKI